MTEDPDDPPPSDAGQPQQQQRPKPRWRIKTESIVFGSHADERNEFPFGREQLEQKLATDNPELAAEIFTEARDLRDVMVDDRVDNVERRAATLQGVVAIAATFVLAGGTLVIAQIDGRAWRTAAGAILFVCVSCFGMCGWLATQASSQTRRWVIPRRADVFDRPSQTLAQVRVARAASFLYAAGQNSKEARWKVTKLAKAIQYLRLALTGLILLALLILAYLATGPTSTSGTGSSADSGSTHQIGRPWRRP